MKDVVEFCNDYLRCGGLFNSELMDNRRIGLLILECRDEIERLREALKAIVALKEDPSLTGDDIADDADVIARAALGEGKE